MRSTPLAVLATCAGLLTVAADARAQGCETGAIAGIVRSDTGATIVGVQLTAPDVPPVMTDSAGRFQIPRACAGPVMLTARKLGFGAATVEVMVPPGGELRVEVTLFPAAQQLAAVQVRARETPGATRLRDFYLRKQRFPGHFLTREDLEPFDNSRFTDVLRARVPGVQVSQGSGAIRSRLRIRGQRCAPMVWLDGMATPAGEFDLDVLQPSTIAAVEVYSGPATIPAQFRTPFGRDACGGVIVIWSRIGRDQWDEPRQPDREVADAGRHLPIYRPEEVDSVARVDTTAMITPIYPDSLHAFRVEGAAVAELIVDTTGFPVAGSVRILSASAPAFGTAVVRAISFSRFIPARMGGRAVRQRMELPFEFTMDPRS